MKRNEFLERTILISLDISCDNNVLENVKLDQDSLARKMNAQLFAQRRTFFFSSLQQSLVNQIKYCYSFETMMLSIIVFNRCIMQMFK